MHGIIAHRLWEKNLGNVTKVFVNNSFEFIAQTLWFCFPNFLVRISLARFAWRNPSQKVWAMKPKSSVNDLKGIVSKDLGYISKIFLQKTMGNNPITCGYIYVIAPQGSESDPKLK